MISSMMVALLSTANATDYTDYASWAADAGAHSTIAFNEVSLGTVLSTQYAGLSFLTSDVTQDGTGFTTDGVMLAGDADITIDFAAPQTSIGADYPGALQINLFDAAGALVYSSANFGGSGSGFFGGVVSPVPFVRAVLVDHFNFSSVFIDNLYFTNGGAAGPSIALGGSCPTAVTVAATGFTPGGNVAIVRSNGTGSFVVPSGGCAGTVTGLSASGVGLVTVVNANGSGNINYAGGVGAGICTKFLQFVDLTTCATSNVDQF
jgi:hypothetical protein